MPQTKRLNKLTSATQQFLDAIQKGEERTYEEWSQVLYGRKDRTANVRAKVKTLRRHGFHIAPVSNHPCIAGPLRLFTDDRSSSNQVTTRYSSDVIGRMKTQAEFILDVLKNLPELANRIMPFVEEIVTMGMVMFTERLAQHLKIKDDVMPFIERTMLLSLQAKHELNFPYAIENGKQDGATHEYPTKSEGTTANIIQ